MNDAAGMVRVTSPDQVRVAADLFREYQRSLSVDLCFQNFDREVATLPGDYAPPGGALWLVRISEAYVGCIAIRRLGLSLCEMKRLFVRPSFHGKGFGRTLAQTAIDEARRIGYRAMRLDTLPSMKTAAALYRSLGFKEIPAYTQNPTPGTLYFELDLAAREEV